MTETAESEELFVRYLLGELTWAEQARIEEVFFADDGYFEQLLAAEDELKYTYVQGLLEPLERERFEARFAARPDRLGSLAFASGLISILSATGTEQQPPEIRFTDAGAAPFAAWRSRLAASWHQSVRPGLRATWARLARVRFTPNWSQLGRLSLGANRERLARLWRWARPRRLTRPRLTVNWARLARIGLLCAAVILAAGVFAIVAETIKYHNQVRRLTQALTKNSKDQGYWTQIEQEKRRASSLAEELDIERSRRLMLEEQVGRRNRQMGQKPEVGSGSVASFIISPGVARDSGQLKKPILQSGDAERLRLQMKLDVAGEYRSYEALLKTAEGKLVSGQAGLQPARLGSIHIIALTLPARVVQPGDYHLELKGIAQRGRAEAVDDYYFSIAKRE